MISWFNPNPTRKNNNLIRKNQNSIQNRPEKSKSKPTRKKKKKKNHQSDPTAFRRERSFTWSIARFKFRPHFPSISIFSIFLCWFSFYTETQKFLFLLCLHQQTSKILIIVILFFLLVIRLLFPLHHCFYS